MATVIEVKNLSKIYRLGEIGTGTISHDLHRWVAKMRGKEDPFLKIGQSNDRTQKGSSEIVYSLRDISFKIEQGDAVGIIGRNGAGKSTLLKILSRVTSPSTGVINVNGRIASLLEVGTGFHPELTGRENIYLNGAIMGMRKKEITKKLDEIIDFSGVERYIDTPVKRYSSGMYVRLAFAVAAHLESEILIVDEVLAVGDAEFQKKCLGKMSDVSKGEGRTVLFVSHNMAAINTLCNQAILLKNGGFEKKGKVNEIVDLYLDANDKPSELHTIDKGLHTYLTDEGFINSIKITDLQNISISSIGFLSDFKICFEFVINKNIKDLIIDFKIVSNDGVEITHNQSNLDNYTNTQFSEGKYQSSVTVENRFQPGFYYITFGLHHQKDGATFDYLETVLKFEVLSFSLNSSETYLQNWEHGFIKPKANWIIEKI